MDEERAKSEKIWGILQIHFQLYEFYDTAAEQNALYDLLSKKTQFATELVNHIYEKPEQAPAHQNYAEMEYESFIKLADTLRFARLNPGGDQITVSDLLSRIVRASPKIKHDRGEDFNKFVKDKLSRLLMSELGWRKLKFDANLFREIYHRLIGQLWLKHKTYMFQVRFACLTASVLIAMINNDVESTWSHFKNLDGVDNFEQLLECVLNSAQFEHLSVYLIVGFSSMIKYWLRGGNVFQSTRQVYQDAHERDDETMFQLRLDMSLIYYGKFQNNQTDSELETIRKEFLLRNTEILVKGLGVNGDAVPLDRSRLDPLLWVQIQVTLSNLEPSHREIFERDLCKRMLNVDQEEVVAAPMEYNKKLERIEEWVNETVVDARNRAATPFYSDADCEPIMTADHPNYIHSDYRLAMMEQ